MSKRHILVVEDTPDLRSNMIEMLLMEKYSVSHAGHGKEALPQIKNRKPDLIITDLLMPEMNGFEFISEVRKEKKWQSIPILVFSAMPAIENEEKVLRIGAAFYLKKPSTLDELLSAVKKLI